MRTLDDMTAAVSASNEDARFEEVAIPGLPGVKGRKFPPEMIAAMDAEPKTTDIHAVDLLSAKGDGHAVLGAPYGDAGNAMLHAHYELKALALAMITAMVDSPSTVAVEVTGDDKTVDLSVSVAQGEVGLVIGKEGRNARALRTILGAAAARLKVRVTLNIEEAK